MPPVQSGHARRLRSGRWQLRYYAAGEQRTADLFGSRSAAHTHYRDTVEPQLRGHPEPAAELTLAELLELYVTRHEAIRSARTIRSLRKWMRRPLETYDGAKLPELEAMVFEPAGWSSKLPSRYGPKVMGALRQMLAGRALAALNQLPARRDTPLLFRAPGGRPLNLGNFRKRIWSPAVVPATPYDMRDTFASNALAAGITAFELARGMGTSVRVIERYYGALLDGAHAGITRRLDTLEGELERNAEAKGASGDSR